MAKVFLFFLFLLPCSLFSQDRLLDKYCVSYGNPQADVVITEYFSFACPQCLRIFKNEFKSIQEEYLQNGEVRWDFHPIPTTEIDVWAMICMEELDFDQKQVFLESLFQEFEGVETATACALMRKAMEFFHQPIPQIGQVDYLSASSAFHDAFKFMQQNKIQAIPAVDINGKFFNKLPQKRFIDKQLKRLSS
jgi:hypothetical protein